MYKAITDAELTFGCPFGQHDCDTCIMIEDCFLSKDYVPEISNNLILYNNLKKIRKAKGITQKDLAESIGVSKNTISSIETNKFGCSAYTALLICDVLECKFEDLFFLGFPY